MEYKLKIKDTEHNKWLCTENYKLDEVGEYEQISIAHTMEDLINYALTYNYSFELPSGYTYQTLYSIIVTTSNFDPRSRENSVCTADIIYNTFSEKEAYNQFKTITNNIKKHRTSNTKTHFCWHTEDFAYNQVIHSYDLQKSYIVKKEN